MIILAIETSCDDTCVAIFEVRSSKFEVRSNIVSSQVKLHKKYGGVWPFLAKREHQKNLPIVFKRALKEAKLPKIDTSARTSAELSRMPSVSTLSNSRRVDLVAVTIGPGLEPCLWVGVNFAKELAQNLNLPMIPINHIEAHIFASFISNLKSQISNIKSLFPTLCLVVSGGHTQLILMRDFFKYKILGETRDDAAGECFDKVARILGLGYPGGPAIEKLSKTYHLSPKTYKIELPRPMINQKNYDFSFSGLKTAVLYKVKGEKLRVKDKRYIQEMSREVQQAIIDVLISKTLKAAKEYRVKNIILGGGVASNEELRKQFKKAIKRQLPNASYLVPDASLCTDNAAMVALAAYFHYLKRKIKSWKEIKANANLRIDE
jgi:N6-L-threonylcarbamoyladenine synthase